MLDQQNIDTAKIPAVIDPSVSVSNETLSSSVHETEDRDSNPKQEESEKVTADSVKVTESTVASVDQTNTPSANSTNLFALPNPNSVFDAYDTTGASEICKVIADDKGKAIGDTKLYKELEAFLKKYPQYSSNLTAAPKVSTPITPESEGSVSE